jgi:hypothetical protein
MEATRFSQGGQDQPTRGELKIESWKIQPAKLRRLPAAKRDLQKSSRV